MDAICGVYAIFDSRTNECLYVGQSSNVLLRFKKHTYLLKSRKHRKDFVAWFEDHNFDVKSIKFEIMEMCDNEDGIKNSLEIKWFNELSPKFYGQVPSMNSKWSHSEETISKIKDHSQRGCKIFYYDCEGCGKVFISNKRRYKKHVFCSVKCSSSHFSVVNKFDYDTISGMYASGMTQCEIAKELNVSNTSISKFMMLNGISTGYSKHKK